MFTVHERPEDQMLGSVGKESESGSVYERASESERERARARARQRDTVGTDRPVYTD